MSKRSLRTAAALASIAAVCAVVAIAMRVDLTPAADIPNLSDIATPASAQTTAPPPETAGRHPLSTGEMATFVFKAAPEPVADLAFTDGSGTERKLSYWKGRVVLLNLWATWCAPCRKEMPALDRLQAELGSAAFEVVALAVDRTGTVGARKFLAETKVEKLGLYVDSTAKTSSQLKVIGLPTTLLIGRDGREIGRLVGPAEWDGADAKRLIAAAMAN